jgi:hypothetical protein
MNFALETMTGMPMGKKKTRRGRRRKGDSNPHTHLSKCHHALKSGDHAAVKRHAFDLIKSLPVQERGELIETMEKAVEAKPEPKPSASGSARLALLLKGRKK